MYFCKHFNIPGFQYTFIACWWGKYENVFTQENHIPWEQRPRGIWYSWVKKFSYFQNPQAINVLLYRMNPRKHIHVKYYCKHILSPLERCLRLLKTTSTTSDEFRVAGKPARLPRGWNMIFISRNMIYILCDHVFWFLPIVQSN